jgi:hypothetical protein
MRLSLRRRSGGWSVVTARVPECHLKRTVAVTASTGSSRSLERDAWGFALEDRLLGSATGRERLQGHLGGSTCLRGSSTQLPTLERRAWLSYSDGSGHSCHRCRCGCSRCHIEDAAVRGCVGIARAFGIDKQLVTPTNPDLRFEEGLVFPPPRPMGWTVFLMFGDSQQSEALEWWMSSERPISYTDCFHIMHEVPLEAAGGLRFCELAGGGQAPLPASSRRDRTER